MRPAWTLLVFVLAACSSSRPALDDGTAVALSLSNRAQDTVCYLFLSTPGQDTWSDDLLGSATIAPGSSRTVRVPRGVWDLRTENCNHELMGVVRGARINRATSLYMQ